MKFLKGTIILTVCLSLSCLMFCFYNSKIAYSVKSEIEPSEYRTYLIQYDIEKLSKEQVLEKINSIKNINHIFEMDSYLISMETFDNKPVLLIGTENYPIPILEGTNRINDNQIICSNQLFSLSDKNDIDLHFINNSEKETFEFVGTFDFEKYKLENNVCYTTFNTVKRLNTKYQESLFLETEDSFVAQLIIVDNNRNLNKIKSDLKTEGISLRSIFQIQ